ncbi:glycosyltransferase [Methylobacterium terricola]|uniref:Glycosyltransferase n=1 Tax=Methylobacterium terricola TaxID=2583531 RepID=A0A5C4L653_9HYPH|nr:glycosyltransferase [Methylobacterium terricola]TNC06815.1 glycosyltransferase [Methylobacterium terricola]
MAMFISSSVLKISDGVLNKLNIGLIFSSYSASNEPTIDVIDDYGHRLLHIKFYIEEARVAINTESNLGWSINETQIPALLHNDKLNMIKISYGSDEEASFHSKINIYINDCNPVYLHVRESAKIKEIRSDFKNCRIADLQTSNSDYFWRFRAKPSGFDATPAFDMANQALVPGLTALIRARNEESNIISCIETLADLVTEVVLVDNGSTDRTMILARQLQLTYKNLRIYHYPIKPPRVGNDHADAVRSESTNTLGKYYNWCLSHVRTYNFIKWDADFVCIRKNLKDLISQHQLLTRSDPLTIWVGGSTIYTNGTRFMRHKDSMLNEFRVHSKLWGAKWVDISNWEEMDQTYLYRSPATRYLKPVFAELYNFQTESLAERGSVQADERDRLRMSILNNINDLSVNDKNLDLLPDITQNTLEKLEITDREIDRSEYMLRRFNSLPKISMPFLNEIQDETIQPDKLAVLCITHQKVSVRQDLIRKTWAKDFSKIGLPVFFITGDYTQDKYKIDGDNIIVPVRDTYEFLPEKVYEAFAAVRDLGFERILKVDDDCVLNACTILQRQFQDHHYCGSQIIKHTDAIYNWHKGKCYNRQLEDFPAQLNNVQRWFGGGMGYMLDKVAIDFLLKNKSAMCGQLYEDVAVGRIMQSGGLSPKEASEVFQVVHFNKCEKYLSDGNISDIIWDVPADSIEDVYDMILRQSWAYPADIGKIITDW